MCTSKGKQWFWSILVSVLIIILLGCGQQVQSQEKYPTKAIDIIISMSPGGVTDLIARLTASYLKEKWGIPVNVLNKPGGNSLPAVTELYSAQPDGYTVLADIQPCSSMMAVVEKNLPFNIMDRTFIGIITNSGGAFIVASNSPYKNIEDVIAEAKRDPDNFTWTSMGAGSGPDINARQLFKAIGVDILRTKPVLCKGGAEAATLTAGGNVKLGLTSPISTRGVAQAGLIRFLASTIEKDPEIPNVPTMAQLGYPTVSSIFWIGFSGPPKVPSYIVDIWDKTLKEVVNIPEYKSRLMSMGVKTVYLNSREMKNHVMNETKEFSDLYDLKKK